MEKTKGLIDKDIRGILLSDDYVNTLKKIGFSKEFVFNEQIRKQKECIEYLIERIEELKKIITGINKKNSDLSSLIKEFKNNLN
jgi:hypothetical protein